MVVLMGSRGTGKTYELIKAAAENNGLILVENINRKMRVEMEYEKMKENNVIPKDCKVTVLTYDEQQRYSHYIAPRGHDTLPVYIDDLDVYLNRTISVGNVSTVVMQSGRTKIKEIKAVNET